MIIVRVVKESLIRIKNIIHVNNFKQLKIKIKYIYIYTHRDALRSLALPFSLGLYWDHAILVPAKYNCYLCVTRFGTNAWNKNKIRQKVTRAHHYYLTFEIKELIR